MTDVIQRENPKWGCSSAGRAPALQAGGHGFEPHHLHHTGEPGTREDGKNQQLRTVCTVPITDVSIELSSRTVSRKVFSPLQSLTSVFGMGTGGPSAFVTPTFSLKKSYSLKIEQQSI